MPVTAETTEQIRDTLHRYCNYFDSARFNSFAGLFEHGRWFMVDEPGSGPVREWIDEHVVLYEGRPLTRHKVTSLIVGEGQTAEDYTFECYLAIWQHLPAEKPRLLTHARFRGTFVRQAGSLQWREHAMSVDYAGDLSTHIRGGIASVAPPV